MELSNRKNDKILNPTWAGLIWKSQGWRGLVGPRVISPEWDLLET